MSCFKSSVIFVISVVASSSVLSGTLDDLEESATKPNPQPQKSTAVSEPNESSTNSSGGLGAFVAETAFKIIYGVASEAGSISMSRFESTAPSESQPYFRLPGDATLPIVKLDSQWFEGDGGISASLNNIEIGYGPFGLSHTKNRLFESGDHMDISYTLGHYRMSLGNSVAISLALGGGSMEGNQTTSGSVFAIPVRAQITPSVHFEYYPVWSSFNNGSMSEHSFSLKWKHKYFGLSGGYKNWVTNDVGINGFFAGLYLVY